MLLPPTVKSLKHYQQRILGKIRRVDASACVMSERSEGFVLFLIISGRGGAYYVLFWMTVIQHWLRYKCIMLQCFAYLVKLKLKSIPQMLYGIWYDNTGCHSRKGPNFGRVFLMLNYTDITQNTYIQSWTVTEIMAGEKCGNFAFPRSIRLQLYR